MGRNLITIIIIGLTMFAVLIAGIQTLSTDNPIDVEAMGVANQLYTAGNHAQAAQIYEQLLSQGMVDSSLYYNLGNAYYFQGDLGRAILNYQRAARLDPRDPAIKANLGTARAQAGNEYITEPDNPLYSLSRFTSSWLTLNESALTTLGLWFTLGFFILFYRQIQPGKMRTLVQYGMILTTLIFLVAGISFGFRLYDEQTRPEAVIILEEVTINSNPGDEYATEFRLLSGSEVKLIDVQGSWAKLALPNEDLDGWIPLNSFETVSLKDTNRNTNF